MSIGDTKSVVLGIDLGTTAVKALAATRNGEMVHQSEHGCALRTEQSGEAVQDAELVRNTVFEALRETASWLENAGYQVEALSFSAAMHTLVGLDSQGKPVTTAYTWADTRASEVAQRLRADRDQAAGLHGATGSPVHTQSVMVKLAWLNENPEHLAGAAEMWCSLKDFVLATLVGRVVTDHSMASGTGLLNVETLGWHEPALTVAGVDAEHLPEPHAPTKLFPLKPQAAKAIGVAAGTPVVLGAGDGPLANLGVGAVRPGVAALSLGTSGALRVVRNRPSVDARGRTFSYALADDLWVIGGAVSNGAGVAKWASDLFGVDIPSLLDQAREVPPGAQDLIALPYLLGERAPWWESGLTGMLAGLRQDHRHAEITRALVEGVAMQFALVRDALAEAGSEVRAVRATGGGFRSDLWADVVAAALNIELELANEVGGSALGAALLGWHALGGIGSLEAAADLVQTGRTVTPDAKAARVMQQHRPLVARLHEVVAELGI